MDVPAVRSLVAILLVQAYITQLEGDLHRAIEAVRRLLARLAAPPTSATAPDLLSDFTQDLHGISTDLHQCIVYLEELKDRRDAAFSSWVRQHLGIARLQLER